MRKLSYPVPPQCHGMRVEHFARKVLGLSARVFIKQKYIENGMQINGSHCKSIDLLKVGDVFTLLLPEECVCYEAAELPVEVCWENGDYLVVAKPAGMPVHPSPGHDRDSLLNALAKTCRAQGFLFRPLYRLDKDTSGLVVVAKSRLAASSAVLTKNYYAVCQGKLQGKGTITLPIGRAEGSKIKRETGHGETAVTHWEALASDGKHSLIKIQLDTGRTHQIRTHFAAIGYPLAGDDLYGGSRAHIARQALHCKELLLQCPLLGLQQKLELAFPRDICLAFPKLFSNQERMC